MSQDLRAEDTAMARYLAESYMDSDHQDRLKSIPPEEIARFLAHDVAARATVSVLVQEALSEQEQQEFPEREVIFYVSHPHIGDGYFSPLVSEALDAHLAADGGKGRIMQSFHPNGCVVTVATERKLQFVRGRIRG